MGPTQRSKESEYMSKEMFSSPTMLWMVRWRRSIGAQSERPVPTWPPLSCALLVGFPDSVSDSGMGGPTWGTGMSAPPGVDPFLQLSCFNSQKPMLQVDGFTEQLWQVNPALPSSLQSGDGGQG